MQINYIVINFLISNDALESLGYLHIMKLLPVELDYFRFSSDLLIISLSLAMEK